MQTSSIHDNRQIVIPLVAGSLKAAAYQKGLQRYYDIEIFDSFFGSFGGDAWIIERVLGKRPDILCVSLYCWNLMRSLYIIEQLKRYFPEVKIIVGGPEVFPDNSNLTRCPYIDIFVMRQGEETFVEILKYLLKEGPIEEIDNIFYRQGNRVIVNKDIKKGSAIKNSENFPSPYLMRFIDPEIIKMKIMLIETTKGCKLRCKYCSESTRAEKVLYFPCVRSINEIKWAIKNRIRGIYIIDSSFNLSENFNRLCTAIASINKNKKLNFYNIEIRADYIDGNMARLLKKINTKTVEVGLQSINPVALANVNRNSNLSKIVKGIKILMKNRLHIIVNLIIGLPGEKLSTFKKACYFLKKNKICNRTTAFFLRVLPGSALRSEAKLYGLKYQTKPPYFILKTATMSHRDILKSSNYYSKVFKNEIESYRDISDKFMFMLYLSGYYPSKFYFLDEIRKKSPISMAGIKYPFSKLYVDFDRLQDLNDLSFYSEISHRLTTPFTVWLKSKDLGKQEIYISNILKKLSLCNPQILWNIILESENGIRIESIKKLLESIHCRKHYLDYESIYSVRDKVGYWRRPTIKIIAIAQGGENGQIPRDLDTASEIYSFWHIGKKNQDTFKDYFIRANEKKVLIEFDNSLFTDEVIAILGFVKKCKTIQEVHYKDALLEIISMNDIRFARSRSNIHYELTRKSNVGFPNDESVIFYEGHNCVYINSIKTQNVRFDLIRFMLRMKKQEGFKNI